MLRTNASSFSLGLPLLQGEFDCLLSVPFLKASPTLFGILHAAELGNELEVALARQTAARYALSMELEGKSRYAGSGISSWPWPPRGRPLVVSKVGASSGAAMGAGYPGGGSTIGAALTYG